jgi:hypothetical protein
LKLADIFNHRVYKYNVLDKKSGKYHLHSMFQISNRKIWKDLINKGVYPRKTYVDIDYVWKHISKDLMHHFIRGYFDGDGTVNTSTIRGKVNYRVGIAGPERFIGKMKNILIKEIRLSNIKAEYRTNLCVITWGGREQIKLIGEWMYKDASVFLERKKDRFDLFCSPKNNRGASGFRGVTWHEANQKWLANISNNKKRINLGYYYEKEDAATAYDDAVIKFNKPLYKLNFKRDI